MADFSNDISKLRVAQGSTHTLLEAFIDKFDKYLKEDNKRHRDLIDFQFRASTELTKVSTTMTEIKREVDGTIPILRDKIVSVESTVRNHTWFIRAIMGVTILAFLGGLITTTSNCNSQYLKNYPVKTEQFDRKNQLKI